MAKKRAKGRAKGRPAGGAARRGRTAARGRAVKAVKAVKAVRATKRPRVKAAKGAKPRSKTKKVSTAAAKPVKKAAPARKAVKGKASPPPRTVVAPKGRRPKLDTVEPLAPGHPRHPPSLERQRRQLREVEDNVPTPPSSLNLDRTPSAARSGRSELREARLKHNETSPELTAGDVDADWEDAYAVGDEAPGGDNPTPDQDRVDDIGKALGVEYEDNEELKSGDKIANRDKHRWELDPASAEDYPDHEE
jgi:hypothetical protein